MTADFLSGSVAAQRLLQVRQEGPAGLRGANGLMRSEGAPTQDLRSNTPAAPKFMEESQVSYQETDNFRLFSFKVGMAPSPRHAHHPRLHPQSGTVDRSWTL